ncbi:MAG: membrane protein insertase YidC [Pseudothermotoga sp.]|nr:membrane protein insertase YidC [Pseudothermotoga sp.]MCX7813244.1 membrane protein insertase YidC [Pseudothermotoga sp.]
MRNLRFLTLWFLIVLTVLIFAQNEIKVALLTNGVKVQTRFVEYDFDQDGNLANVYLTAEKKVHVFERDKDGFDLFTMDGTPIGGELQLQILGDQIAPNTYRGDLRLVYDFKNVKKTYVIRNVPEYLVEVRIEAKEPLIVNLPRVWFSDNDRIVRDYFISLSPKTRTLSLVKTNSERITSNTVRIERESVLIFHLGPYKRVFLKKLFPNDYEAIVSTLKTIPGSSVWYDAVFYPLVWFFWWLFGLTKNFGWAIILFTIVVRFALYPLYHAQTKSMIKMRKLQPKIEMIRKKYKDPAKQQEELLKAYREEGVNPASGCLMLLIQLPIFFLLYAVIRYFQEEFAFNGRFLIWSDLSKGGFQANAIFILITIVASYYNTLITSQDTRSAWQGILMSVAFTFLFVGLPSGLFLYFTTNTVIQLLVTYYIYKRYKIKGITTRELLGLRSKG